MEFDEMKPSGGLPKSDMTTAARARLPRPVREQQMLDAATEIFGRYGYHGASMDQIASEVGISKPMLYAYFDSKDGLYSACIERAAGDVSAAVTNSFNPDFSPEKALWSGLVAFFEFVRDHPSKWQLVRNQTTSDGEAFQQILRLTHEDLREVIAELARISSKSTPGDPFADEEMRTAVAYAMLGAAMAMANRWLDTDCKTTPTTFSTQLMNFFWLGFNDMAEGEIWSPDTTDAISGAATDAN